MEQFKALGELTRAQRRQFLSMLSRARDPKAAEFDQIVRFLSARRSQAEASRKAAPSRQTKHDLPPPKPRKPLLTNVAGPGEPPRYVGEARPAESLTGPRRVPSLCTDSFGVPFLRFKKPHPLEMDNKVGRNRLLWISRVSKTMSVAEELGPDAALEDLWDDLVHKEMVQEGLAERERKLNAADETYLWSAVVSRLWLELRLEHMWRDWGARGEAMHDIVKQERALAEQERRGGDMDGAKILSATSESHGSGDPPQNGRPRDGKRPPAPPIISVVKTAATPTYNARMSVIRDEYIRQGKTPPQDTFDPFTNPIWAAVIERSKARLLKRMADTEHGNRRFWREFRRTKQPRGANLGHELEEDDITSFANVQRQRE